MNQADGGNLNEVRMDHEGEALRDAHLVAEQERHGAAANLPNAPGVEGENRQPGQGPTDEEKAGLTSFFIYHNLNSYNGEAIPPVFALLYAGKESGLGLVGKRDLLGRFKNWLGEDNLLRDACEQLNVIIEREPENLPDLVDFPGNVAANNQGGRRGAVARERTNLMEYYGSAMGRGLHGGEVIPAVFVPLYLGTGEVGIDGRWCLNTLSQYAGYLRGQYRVGSAERNFVLTVIAALNRQMGLCENQRLRREQERDAAARIHGGPQNVLGGAQQYYNRYMWNHFQENEPVPIAWALLYIGSQDLQLWRKLDRVDAILKEYSGKGWTTSSWCNAVSEVAAARTNLHLGH